MPIFDRVRQLSTKSRLMRHAKPALAIVLSTLFGSAGMPRHEKKPIIWFAPLQPRINPDGNFAGVVDYYDLFKAGADWDYTADNISVFKVYPEFVQNATDNQIKDLIRNLRSRHIKLALETPVLVQTVQCKTSTTKTMWMLGLVRRLHELGADLSYVVMVGPLVDGHTSTGSSSCHRPILDVAADAAMTIRAMREIFPLLEVGEIEPVGDGKGYPNWNELNIWFDSFEHASGTEITFLHVDVNWKSSWQIPLQAVHDIVFHRGKRFGVIFNGDGTELSDKLFAINVQAHELAIKQTLDSDVDDAVFQSWSSYPRRALPDADLTTMTGVVRSYLRKPSFIRRVDTYHFQLVDDEDAAIPGREIMTESLSVDPNIIHRDELDGIVPHTATSALIAIRLHAECKCSPSTVTIRIRSAAFRQKHLLYNQDLLNWFEEIPTGKAVLEGNILEIQASVYDSILGNGQVFAVEPDCEFSLEVLWGEASSAYPAGSITLIFFDKERSEVWRNSVEIKPFWKEVGFSLTDRNGVFALVNQGTIHEIRLSYQGDKQYKPTTWVKNVTSGR